MEERENKSPRFTESPLHPVSPSPLSTWRIFCAIEFPDEVRSELQDHILRLRNAVPRNEASWSRPENIHLTLKFFGDVEQNQIPRISAAARAISKCSPFQFRISGTGAFPKHGAPRVLWIGVEDSSGKLANLQYQFENECAQEGFAKETRSFHPHLTVARLRKPKGARELAEVHKSTGFNEVRVSVSAIAVFRSELNPAGSKYTVISRHEMTATENLG